MVSMGFTDETLRCVMNLIDDNKESYSEEKYIHMCNLLKIVHANVKSQTTSNETISVPIGEETPEKLKLDFKYKHYIDTVGRVTPNDKLNVVNKLFSRNNTHWSLDYEEQARRYLNHAQLMKLYKEERQKRCKNDEQYKQIKESYTNLIGEGVILCFD